MADQPLAPGSMLSWDGRLVFPAALQGKDVWLQAQADDCRAESSQPVHCRVEESDEENNVSEAVRIDLPKLVTLTLRPIADACVDSRAPSTRLGTTQMLVVGGDSRPGGRSNAASSLLQFDLSAIPDGAEVRQADLFATLDKRWSTAGETFRIDLTQVLSEWAESDVCWDNQPEYALTDGSSGVFAVLGPSTDGMEWDVTALVQAWVDGEAHFGLVLQAPGGGDERYTFFSRESAQPPRLIVQCVVTYGSRGNGGGGRSSWAGE
jgi:hypothetical protein